MLISINPVFYFQSAGTCPFPPPSPVGWLASGTQKSSPAHHMVCCSHVQTARTREMERACVCTTGLVNQGSLLLPWLEIPPFLSYTVSRMKKKKPFLWPNQLIRTTSNSLQLWRKQWTEFRVQMQCRVTNFFCRTQKRPLIVCEPYAYIWCLPLHCNTTHSGKGKRPFWLCSS